MVLLITLTRRDLKRLKETVYNYDEKAFIIVSNINPIGGGFFHSVKKK